MHKAYKKNNVVTFKPMAYNPNLHKSKNPINIIE